MQSGLRRRTPRTLTAAEFGFVLAAIALAGAVLLLLLGL